MTDSRTKGHPADTKRANGEVRKGEQREEEEETAEGGGGKGGGEEEEEDEGEEEDEKEEQEEKPCRWYMCKGVDTQLSLLGKHGNTHLACGQQRVLVPWEIRLQLNPLVMQISARDFDSVHRLCAGVSTT